jgi:uncharacterized protein YyaL (SSP411 family)
MAAMSAQHPAGFAQWLLALQLGSEPILEIAIVGDPEAPDTRGLLGAAQRVYRPGQVLAVSATPDESAIPLLHGRARIDGAATAYVCLGFACQRPVTDAAALAAQVEAGARAAG